MKCRTLILCCTLLTGACHTGSTIGQQDQVLIINPSGLSEDRVDVGPGETLSFAVEVQNPESDEVPAAGVVLVYTNEDGLVFESDLVEGKAFVSFDFDTEGHRIMGIFVVDEAGNTGEYFAEVGVDAAQPPRAIIRSPGNGAIYQTGESILLEAELTTSDEVRTEVLWSDSEYGPLAASGDQDGAQCEYLGSDGTFSCEIDLSSGQHLLVLRMWDERGEISTYFREVEVM